MRNKTLCLHAFWRVAGSVSLWAIYHCYQGETTYESTTSMSPKIYNKELHTLARQSAQSNSMDSYTLHRRNVQFCSIPNKKSATVMQNFVKKQYDIIPNMIAHKVIGYPHMADAFLGPGGKSVFLFRNFLYNFRRQYSDDSRKVWRNAQRWWRNKMQVMPGPFCMSHPDPILEAVDRIMHLDASLDEPASIHAIYWIVFGYHAIQARNNGAYLSWADKLDVEKFSAYIRSHMGSELQGCLEDEFNHPSGWFPWHEGTYKGYWSPQGDRNTASDLKLDISLKLSKEFAKVNDPIIQELSENMCGD